MSKTAARRHQHNRHMRRRLRLPVWSWVGRIDPAYLSDDDRAALRNRAPMVPLAALGADELFDFFGNSYDRGRRWLGAKRFPIPLPTRILPIPHRVRLRYVIGDPLPPPAPPEQANDPEVLRTARYLILAALQELIDTELARRVGVTP